MHTIIVHGVHSVQWLSISIYTLQRDGLVMPRYTYSTDLLQTGFKDSRYVFWTIHTCHTQKYTI